MHSIEYAPRVFSVSDASSRSRVRARGIHDDVLEHGAEALRGGVDLRLGLGRELDHLGVAAASNLKMPRSLQPCSSSPIRRRSGSLDSVVLPVPESPKKSGGIPGRLDVGRAVHRQNTLQRQHVVEHGEIDFLLSPGIARSGDDDLARRQVQRDDHVRARAVPGRVGLEGRRGEHRERRLEPGQVRGRRHDEQVAHEEVGRRRVLYEPDRQTVGRMAPA